MKVKKKTMKIKTSSKKKKHPFTKVFGILAEKKGEAMFKSLKQIKKMNLKLQKKRLKEHEKLWKK